MTYAQKYEEMKNALNSIAATELEGCDDRCKGLILVRHIHAARSVLQFVNKPPKWQFDGHRWNLGPHITMTSRKNMEKSGFITALLPHEAQWRTMWTDKCDKAHWDWHGSLKAARDFANLCAKSSHLKNAP